MNSDIGCQKRYGLTGTDIYRIGLRGAQELNDSILHITDASRKNLTWASVPNGVRQKGDLLIAFLEEDPEAAIGVVELFSDEDLAPEAIAATFEMRTSRVLAALGAHQKFGQDGHVRVFALSEIDKGRKQVIFNGRYGGEAIFNGRNRWIEGANNIPAIRLPFPVQRGKKAEWRTPRCPSPARCMHLFKKQWVRCGSSAADVPGVDLGMIYEVYLDLEPAKPAAWLMGRLMPRIEPLLIGAGSCLTQVSALKEKAKEEALTSAAMIGILLLAQGKRKEVYMESREFLIGRFLQLADQLHKAYCMHERGGNIPPQLIGNAAIAMAMERPARALEMLASRMAVYLAWCDRYKGEKAGLVRWFRKELGEIAVKLRGQDLSRRINGNGRAEVLLGYLASNEKSEGDQTNK